MILPPLVFPDLRIATVATVDSKIIWWVWILQLSWQPHHLGYYLSTWTIFHIFTLSGSHRLYSGFVPPHRRRAGFARLSVPPADRQPEAGVCLRPGASHHGHLENYLTWPDGLPFHSSSFPLLCLRLFCQLDLGCRWLCLCLAISNVKHIQMRRVFSKLLAIILVVRFS